MPLFFLDFEASSLDDESYPIEVGWVAENGQGESYLIRPEPSWTNWSASAERLHGISRKMLDREGHPATWVAQRLIAAIKDGMVISDNADNAVYENHWLARLCKLASYPPIQVTDLHFILCGNITRLLELVDEPFESLAYFRQARMLLDESQTLLSETMNAITATIQHAHRALPDAMELWTIWRAVTDAFDQRLSQRALSRDP